jgi:hypothetical protein
LLAFHEKLEVFPRGGNNISDRVLSYAWEEALVWDVKVGAE